MLQLFRVYGANHAVIGVKDSQAPPVGLSHPIVGNPLVLHYHGQPYLDGIVHDHVEECWRYKVTLSFNLVIGKVVL